MTKIVTPDKCFNCHLGNTDHALCERCARLYYFENGAMKVRRRMFDQCKSTYPYMSTTDPGPQCKYADGHEGSHCTNGGHEWKNLTRDTYRIYASTLAAVTPPTKQRPGDQPLPVKNDYPVVQDLVIADIEERKRVGVERYGTVLQPFNGRDVLRDIYEELLDAAIYMRQLMFERVNK